jgi:biotin carboxyl carrier protein
MGKSIRYFAKNLTANEPEPRALDVESLGGGRYLVTLDGVQHEVESLVLPGGALSLINGGHSYAVEFDEKGDELGVQLRGQMTRFDVVDERKLRQRSASSSVAHSGLQEINAPMPGKIVKVFVKEGDAVVEGQPLVVVEAMKMENELKALRAGTVTKVLAKEGTAIENGAKLVVVE